MIAPAQCRAARGLLRWTQDDLAKATRGIGVVTIRQFEAEKTAPRTVTVDAIRTALEAAGVEFIAENGGGPCVRPRKP